MALIHNLHNLPETPVSRVFLLHPITHIWAMAYQAEIDGEQDEWDDEESYIEIGFESDAFRTGSSDSHSSSLRKQWLHRPVSRHRSTGLCTFPEAWGLVINPSPGTFFTGWVRFLWYGLSDHTSYIICWYLLTMVHIFTHTHTHTYMYIYY